METWQRLMWIAVAGAAGTVARYCVAGWVQRLGGATFPWGTLVVNSLGCFLFALVWTLAEQRGVISAQTRTIVLVGFMGAFTTFSTYWFETGQMLRDSEWWLAAANLAAQNTLGFCGLFSGMWVARLM